MRTLRDDPARYPGGLTELADGVYAWCQPNGSWGETNAGAVRGAGGALVVDTLWDLRQARRFLDALTATLASVPITAAVNTHADGDHWWGNAALPASARIHASSATAAAMATGPSPTELARFDRLACAARGVPGAAGRLARYVHRMLGPFDHAAVRLRLPEVTFSGETWLTVGDRPVRLVDLGPAHTSSDVVAHVPDAEVVFCGDLLFIDVAPVCWHGPVTGWIRALDTLLGLDARYYVPGHGPVCGAGQVRRLRDYFSFLVEAGGRAFASGADPVTAARRLLADRGYAGFRDWLEPERLVITLDTVRRDYLGLSAPEPGPAELTRAFGRCARLAGTATRAG